MRSVSVLFIAAVLFQSAAALSLLRIEADSAALEESETGLQVLSAAVGVSPGKALSLGCRLVGVGSAAPATELTNKDMERIVDTNDEWIASRTGIRARRILRPGESLQDLAARAAKNALEQAGVSGGEVDLVILATSSAEDLFGDATGVAHAIGAKRAVAFDLTAACSGFLFALMTAAMHMQAAGHKTAVVVGADALSRWVDWNDRNTCILFGDGAGAVVLQATEDPTEGGILGYTMKSNGAGRPQLSLPADMTAVRELQAASAEKAKGCGKSSCGCGPKNTPPPAARVLSSLGLLPPQPEEEGLGLVSVGKYKTIGMNGREVFKFATREVPAAIQEALKSAGLRVGDVDHLLLHQANVRIMEAVAERLGIPMSKVIANLHKYGNTSAASIPLALDEAVRSGRVKKGDIIAAAGFGAGLSWGAAILRWG